MSEYIEIPTDQLSADTLNAIIEEYITREGTDYGIENYTLDQKVIQVRGQLVAGDAVIVYDPVSESCTLINKK